MDRGREDGQEDLFECFQQSKDMSECPPKQPGTNLESFLFNLGQLLEFLNKQNRGTNKPFAGPLALEPPNTCASEAVLEPAKGAEQGAINVTIRWEEGESSNSKKDPVMLDPVMSDREILEGMQTYVIDEQEVSRMLRGCPSLDSSLPSVSEVEVQERDYWNRVEESWDCEEDRWTEQSFEEDAHDNLDSFLDKMDRFHKSPKHSKQVEALISPKASLSSGRKLRDRNPFLCYSESTRWNRRA